MKSFRSYINESLLTEAYSRDKTWENYGAAVQAKASRLKSYRNNNNVAVFRIAPEEYDHYASVDPEHSNNWIPEHFDDHPVAQILRADIVPQKATTDIPGKAAFMDIVERSAPHPKYIPTITNMYAHGSIQKIEDIETQAADAFERYHKLATHGQLKATNTVNGWTAKTGWQSSNRIPETDFKRFSNLGQVRDAIENHKDFFEKKSRDDLKGQYHIVHNTSGDGHGITVYHPLTKEAASALAYPPDGGPKAAWCTAVEKADYFNHYNKSGPLMIMHPETPEHKGEAYQLHFGNGDQQITDEHDHYADHMFEPGSEDNKRLGGWNITHAKKYHAVHQIKHGDDDTLADDDTVGYYLNKYWKGDKDHESDSLTKRQIEHATLQNGDPNNVQNMIEHGQMTPETRKDITGDMGRSFGGYKFYGSKRFSPAVHLMRNAQLTEDEQESMIAGGQPLYNVHALTKYQNVIHPKIKTAIMNYKANQLAPIDLRQRADFLDKSPEERKTHNFSSIAHKIHIGDDRLVDLDRYNPDHPDEEYERDRYDHR